MVWKGFPAFPAHLRMRPHVVFLELRRHSRVTTGISAFPLPHDEALASYSVSREVSRSVLKCETVLAPLMREGQSRNHGGCPGRGYRGALAVPGRGRGGRLQPGHTLSSSPGVGAQQASLGA